MNASVAIEYRFRHKDGSWRFLEGLGHAFVDELGEVVALIHSRDITDRKLAEESLQEKERLLSEAQHIGRVGSLRYDIDGNALHFSDEIYHLLDILPEKFQHNRDLGEQLVQIRRGALLHDIGKLGIPDSILMKPDQLTPAEWETMKKHPEYAYEMLSPIQYLKRALPIPYFHHEKWDGTGYPLGLRGEQIPLEARIFALVDVWDALLSDRPYRKAWMQERTLEHIRSLAGSHFDPTVVDCFMEIMNS